MATRHWKTVRAVMALVTLVGLFTAGCLEDDDSDGQRSARLRFTHASPDLQTVDVYVDDQDTPLFSGVEYGDTTDFVPLSPRSHVLRFRPAGGNRELEPLFTSAGFSLEENRSVSAVAAGLLQERALDKSLRVLTITEDFTPSAPGMIRVRFLHAGVDAPTLAVDLDGDGAHEVVELARFENSGAGGVELPAQEPLSIALTSQDTARAEFTLLPQPGGARLLVVATGLLSTPPRLEKGFMLLVTNTDSPVGLIRQDPQVHVLNATEHPTPLEVFLGEEEKAEALSFGELSPPIRVPPGSDALALFPAAPTSTRPSDTPLLVQSAAGLDAGGRYLFVVTNRPAPREGTMPTFELLSLPESFEVDEMNPRLQLVHAAPDLAAVDVSPLDTQGRLPAELEINDLAYTQVSEPEGIPLPTVEFTLGVRPAANESQDPTLEFFIGPGPLTAVGVFAVLATREEGAPRLILVNTGDSPWTSQVLVPRD